MTEISKEYATALFMLACEESKERDVMTALEDVSAVLEKNPDFMEFLSSPGIPHGERIQTIDRVFATRMPEQVVSFVQLLCEKGRIRSFDSCVKEYRRLLNVKESVTNAKIVSAIPLTENEKAALKQKLEKISGNTVILECSVDSSLLGGVVVEMNGTVTDGSLRHRLREVKDVMNR